MYIQCPQFLSKQSKAEEQLYYKNGGYKSLKLCIEFIFSIHFLNKDISEQQQSCINVQGFQVMNKSPTELKAFFIDNISQL